MDPDFIFITTYPCPRCQVTLESRGSGPMTWMRCPSCGKAGLPPEHQRSSFPPPDDDTLIIGDLRAGTGALPVRPPRMNTLPPGHVAGTQTARVLIGSGFFFSLLAFLFSLLQSNGLYATVFGVASAVFFFALARPPAQPS